MVNFFFDMTDMWFFFFFQAKYTDPHTKVRYATTEEFKRIRNLTSDIATGYLTLRKANVAV